MPDGQPQLPGLIAYLDDLARLGGAVSAVEVRVEARGHPCFHHVAGFRVGGEPLFAGCRFDAASLTKPWMATLALVLEERGVLRFETALAELFPEAGPWVGATTLEDLLRHRSGIVPWAPLSFRLGKRLSEPAELAALLLAKSFWPALGDGRAEGVYSDLGFILWGLAAERATGERLVDLLDWHVCRPLGVAPLGALAGAVPGETIVECRLDNGREVELAADQGVRLSPQAPFLRGVPQDGNARALGRLTGHAGLFVTAEEMLALGREWRKPSRLLTGAAVERALAGEGAYALGWARQSALGSSGPALEAEAFGHTGFTGGSLWVEPGRGRLVVVLAHRLASRHDFNPVRREIHRLALAV